MAATTTLRLSLPQFVPFSIRDTRARSHRAPSQAATAAKNNEPPKKKLLPFPMPPVLNAPLLSSTSSRLPPPPPPWPRAVSLDVEFSHYLKQPENDQKIVLRVPADVAVVSDEGRVLLRALVAPPPGFAAAEVASAAKAEAGAGANYRWVGGVPREETESSAQALDLDAAAQELARILSKGCLLVGHGVQSDLRALGGDVVSKSSSSPTPSSPSLSVPVSRVRDTSTSPALLKRCRGNRKSSSSRKLDELFLGAFGLELRPSSSSPSSPSSSFSSSSSSPSSSPPAPLRHDPVADAAAAMALYLTFVKGTLGGDASSATELEEMETERVLQEFRARERGKL